MATMIVRSRITPASSNLSNRNWSTRQTRNSTLKTQTTDRGLGSIYPIVRFSMQVGYCHNQYFKFSNLVNNPIGEASSLGSSCSF
jgi:hypothetical protein